MSSYARTCIVLVLFLAVLPPRALAWQNAAPEQDVLKQETEADLRDPSLSSPAREPNLQAILSATTSSTQAQAEIGLKQSDTFSGSIKIAGPLGKQNTQTKLASLTNLSDQATLTVGIHYLTPSPTAKAFSLAPEKFFDALCAAWLSNHPGKAPKDCPSDLSTNDLTPSTRRAFLNFLNLAHGIFVLALEGTYGAPKTFDFLSGATFANEKEHHSASSIAVSAGWLPLQVGFFFVGLTFRYEQSYMSTVMRDICQPLGTQGTSQCQNLPIGPPQKMISNIAQLEVRQYFAGGQLAINPRISRDFKQKVTGIEIPVYFLKDGKGNLNGGISPGWRSDTRSVTVMAFVGSMSNPLGSASSSSSGAATSASTGH
jgi:hypothetical protein